MCEGAEQLSFASHAARADVAQAEGNGARDALCGAFTGSQCSSGSGASDGVGGFTLT